MAKPKPLIRLSTVSDSAMIYSAVLDDEGQFGALTLLAEGVPGDGIAIGADGTIYVTTHPYNTVVRIGRDGSRNVIADESSGATGSTDIAISSSQERLYMVTDGGLFGGKPGAAGQLVLLSLD